ncbi:hypothetical protein Efla_000197 [Eimeria flavescens]
MAAGQGTAAANRSLKAADSRQQHAGGLQLKPLQNQQQLQQKKKKQLPLPQRQQNCTPQEHQKRGPQQHTQQRRPQQHTQQRQQQQEQQEQQQQQQRSAVLQASAVWLQQPPVTAADAQLGTTRNKRKRKGSEQNIGASTRPPEKPQSQRILTKEADGVQQPVVKRAVQQPGALARQLQLLQEQQQLVSKKQQQPTEPSNRQQNVESPHALPPPEPQPTPLQKSQQQPERPLSLQNQVLEREEEPQQLQQTSSVKRRVAQQWQHQNTMIEEAQNAHQIVASSVFQKQQVQQADLLSSSQTVFTAQQVAALQEAFRAFQQEAVAAPTLAAAAAAKGKAAALLLGASARRLAAVAPRLSASLSRRMAQITQQHAIVHFCTCYAAIFPPAEVDSRVLQGVCKGCGLPLIPFLTSSARTQSLPRGFARRWTVWRTKKRMLKQETISLGCHSTPVDAFEGFSVTSCLVTSCKLCGHQMENAIGHFGPAGEKEQHRKQQQVEDNTLRGAAFKKQKRLRLQRLSDQYRLKQQLSRMPMNGKREKCLCVESAVCETGKHDHSLSETHEAEAAAQGVIASAGELPSKVESHSLHSASFVEGKPSTACVASSPSITTLQASSQSNEATRSPPCSQEVPLREPPLKHSQFEGGQDNCAAGLKGRKGDEPAKGGGKQQKSVYAILADLDC